MIAVDSNVLIDLIGDTPDLSLSAADALRLALSLGPVVACEVAVAEVVAGLGSSALIVDVMEDMGIEFSPLELRAAVRAGEMQRRYRQRRVPPPGLGHPSRTIPDFLIGAHALLQCQGLITRDAGFFRDYFKGLKVIVPTA
jgi:predicted nucleic acid-binding protein